MDAQWIHRFLQVLRLAPEALTLSFLQKLVRAHAHHVPYENISKLLRAASQGPSIPGPDEYLSDIENFGFGGTCFALNGYFVELLRGLGFAADLLSVDSNGEAHTHATCRVRIEAQSYIVDLGLCAPFMGPFLLAPLSHSTLTVGRRVYTFTADAHGENYCLTIGDGSHVIRTHQSHPEPRSLAFFDRAIAQSFDKEELFMTVLCAHRMFGPTAKVVWGCEYIEGSSEIIIKRELNSLAQMEAVFCDDLKLAAYPLRQAVDILYQINGIKLFNDC